MVSNIIIYHQECLLYFELYEVAATNNQQYRNSQTFSSFVGGCLNELSVFRRLLYPLILKIYLIFILEYFWNSINQIYKSNLQIDLRIS